MKNEKKEDSLTLPCGHCRACRIARSREWYVRLYHELLYHEDAVFVTLTYDEEHLPNNQSINKNAIQLWMKRLRKEIAPRRIKYYAIGEYGEQTKRPHYHAIIYNISKREHKMNGTIHAVTGPIVNTWKEGGIGIGTAETNSIRS